jgi:death-on-curing protein
MVSPFHHGMQFYLVGSGSRKEMKNKHQEKSRNPIMRGRLTAEKIIEIHDDIIERYGGTEGILNQGTIEYLVYQLDRKNDVFKKAALALETIIIKHPFLEGNKRTAFEVADFLLRYEEYHIHANEEEIQHALLRIAKYQCTVKEIEE